ncbi:hypothetical protein ACSU1N_05225 [Thermogladius sp. 4427co]|uniref:hypothetical protein n=1 Tax=Thermogladius sp. 4427co TaxID=3450718 RepID=UPI003F7A3474
MGDPQGGARKIRIKFVNCLDALVDSYEKAREILLKGLDLCEYTKLYIEEVSTNGLGTDS